MDDRQNPILARHNPFRPPDWRYRRIEYLLTNNKQPNRSYDDEYIKEGHKFFKKWRQTSAQSEKAKLYVNFPALFEAVITRFHGPREQLGITEARILSMESLDDISKMSGLKKEALEWYVHLFFDVLTRIQQSDYILRMVVGGVLEEHANDEETISEEARVAVYKLFGYKGGPLVLDLLLFGLPSTPPPDTAEKAEKWMLEAYRTGIVKRAAMGAHVCDINKFNIMQLLELAKGMYDTFVSGDGASENDYVRQVEKALDGVEMATGKRAIKKQAAGLQEFANTGVEPRAEEALHLATVGTVPDGLAGHDFPRDRFEKSVEEETEGN